MDSDTLGSYSVKQLKNIISKHNSLEKVNVIKSYGSMKKAELVKAIKQKIKQERLMTILKSLKLSNAGKVDELFGMIEEGGSKMKEKVKKSVSVKPPTSQKEEKDVGTRFYEKVVDLNKKNKKYLELLVKPVFGEKRKPFSVIDILKKKLDRLGYVDDKDSWNQSSKYNKGVYLIEENTQTTERFVRRILEIYYDEERKSLTGSARTRELNKQLKDIMSYGVSKADINNVFSKISVEGQQKIYKEFSRNMLKVPSEYTDKEKVDMLNFYIKGIVRPET